MPSRYLLAFLSHHDIELECFVFTHPLFCLMWIVVQDGCPVDEDIFTGVAAGIKGVSVLNTKLLNDPSPMLHG